VITIFSFTDEDGDRIVAHIDHNNELVVEVFNDADPGDGTTVYVPAADARQLAAALARHWKPEEQPKPPADTAWIRTTEEKP
jgi:hypothetical protein